MLAASVDEGRKRILLIAAAILAARRLATHSSASRKHAVKGAISDAINFANQITREIDRLWPSPSDTRDAVSIGIAANWKKL